MTIELHNNVYRAVGDADSIPLILVHGFPVDHRMWDQCAQEIIKQADAAGVNPFPVWAPDMPGAGEGPIPSVEASGGASEDGAYEHALDRMADAYVELLHQHGYQKAVWAGLSMGGYLVLDIQRLHPETVAGIALCDTKGDADSKQARANRIRIAGICETTGSHEPVMHFAQANPDTDSTIKQSQQYIDQFTTWINEQPANGIAWRERMAAGRPDLNDQLPAITAPAAVICGDLDPSSPPAAMSSLAAKMSKTRVKKMVIDDCGHFSAYEHPDAVAQALVTLMQEALKTLRSE